LAQKHRDQSTELERQISDEAHWIRCENSNPHCYIAAVNRSDWRVEKWSGWRESNPLHNQNPNRQSSETVQIPSSLPFLNESHTVSVSWVATGEDDCCDSPHPTRATAAIVVSRSCFITSRHSSRWVRFSRRFNFCPRTKTLRRSSGGGS
jgi:hypothetical protein